MRVQGGHAQRAHLLYRNVNALYSNPEGILTMKKTIKMLRATLLVLLGLAFIGTAPALGQDVVLDFGGDIAGRPNDEFTVHVSTSNLTAALYVRNYEFVINFDNSLVSIDPSGVVTGAYRLPVRSRRTLSVATAFASPTPRRRR